MQMGAVAPGTAPFVPCSHIWRTGVKIDWAPSDSEEISQPGTMAVIRSEEIADLQ